MQVPSGIDGSAATIAFATYHRRFESAINHLRSAVFGVSVILLLFLRFDADLRGMRTFAYTRLRSDSGASKGGRRTLTQRTSRRSACFVRIQYSPNVLVLFLAAVGALEGVRHATFGSAKESKCSEERACCLLQNPAVVCRFR